MLAAALSLLAVLGVGIPAGVTGANLTSTKTATVASAVGSYCATPSSTTHKNVYPVSTFATVTAAAASGFGTTTLKMMVLPVVKDASFAPVQTATGASGQIGIRLWSCSALPANSIKATSWRGYAYGTSQLSWSTSPTLGSFASARLNPAGNTLQISATSAFTPAGPELRDLHRGVNPLGIINLNATSPVTQRYSWLLDADRSTSAPTVDPGCSNSRCRVVPKSPATMAAAFSAVDTSVPATGVPGRTATYTAEKYWNNGGALPCNPGRPCSAQASILTAPASPSVATYTADATGGLLQWVVLEWTGTAAVPADLAVEVYVVQ